MSKLSSGDVGRTTIYDVAKAAGVSHMTVSRVLRQTGNVSADKVKRVQEAIKRLNYQPDPVLSALAAYRTKKIGPKGSANLAFLDRDGTEYSGCVFEGLREEAELHGYHVEKQVLPRDSQKQRPLLRRLYHRGVRGLLLGPAFEEWSFTGWNWDAFALVSLGALSHEPRMHSVCMNYFEAAFSATRKLWEAGCHRIGFAVDPQLEKRTGHRWLGGYMAALGPAKPLVYDRVWPIMEDDFTAWRKRKRLDGLLTLNAALYSGWSGPAEHFVLVNSMSRQSHPGIRRFYLDPRLIGAEGLRCMHHLLLRREYGLPEAAKVTGLQGIWLEDARV